MAISLVPSLDPVKWLWELVTAAVTGSAGEVTGIVTNFLFSTRDVLDGGRPFTEGSVIARFQPSAVVLADAALAAALIWGSYHIMFGHGLRTLYSVRILLPRVLLAIVLANVSLPLLQAVIDVNNALCTAVLGIGVSFDPGSITGFRDLGSGPALSAIVVAALFAGYAVLAVAYALRYSLLIVLAITAPLAALLFVLPDTHHYARKWGSLFVSTLLMQPLQLLILQVGLQLDLGTAAWNPGRHLFALATLLLAFKVPGALHATSTVGTQAMSTVKHYAHLVTHGIGHVA
jgi:hypothetical protein